jgi:hypothetical protein
MGFAVGQNIRIEYHYAEGQQQKVLALAADLVQRRVSLIVADANTAAAAKAATQVIPIVFFQGGDPVRAGLVASLNRPGGNLTGFTRLGADLASSPPGPSRRQCGKSWYSCTATASARHAVAPRAGAWIETRLWSWLQARWPSRPSRRGVDSSVSLAIGSNPWTAAVAGRRADGARVNWSGPEAFSR